MVKEIQPDFKDKTALITGGARNIGLTVARDLAARGVSVAIADICRDLETVPYPLSSSDDLEKSVAEISSAGVKAIGLRCDVRDENRVRETVERVIDEFGKLVIGGPGKPGLQPVPHATVGYVGLLELQRPYVERFGAAVAQ